KRVQRIEQAKARLTVSRLLGAEDHVLFGERRKHTEGHRGFDVGHSCRRLLVPAISEHSEPVEHQALFIAEQVIAPPDRGAQRSMPFSLAGPKRRFSIEALNQPTQYGSW